MDLGVAERVGAVVGGPPGITDPLPGDLLGIALDAERRIVAYTGLRPQVALPPPEPVTREAWRSAALRSMARVLAPVTDRLGSGAGFAAPLARFAGSVAVGVEAGALAGLLGRRVLGQYELDLVGDAPPPRLLLVAPNLLEAAGELEVDSASLVTWVAVHEVTHAVQFSSTPWLRERLGALLTELLAGLDTNLDLASLLKKPTREDLDRLIRTAREGSLLQAVAGPERTRLLDEVQATMALVEGHAEHVMDVVGAEVLDDLPALRTALDRRRGSRPVLWSWFERVLGLELKLRQYQDGKAFCDGVVALAGPAALHRAFAAPELAPTLEELADPAAWVQRTEPRQLPRAS